MFDLVDNDGTVKQIQDFLWQKIGRQQIREIASSELMDIHLTNGNSVKPTELEIDNYINDHYNDLRKRANSALQATAEKMIAKPKSCNIAQDLGIVTLLLVPPLYPICSYIAVLFSEEKRNWTDIGSSLACCFILIVPLLAYLIATFRKAK